MSLKRDSSFTAIDFFDGIQRIQGKWDDWKQQQCEAAKRQSVLSFSFVFFFFSSACYPALVLKSVVGTSLASNFARSDWNAANATIAVSMTGSHSAASIPVCPFGLFACTGTQLTFGRQWLAVCSVQRIFRTNGRCRLRIRALLLNDEKRERTHTCRESFDNRMIRNSWLSKSSRYGF